MNIGNILVPNNKYIVQPYYKKCLSLNDIDANTPTLIIGYNEAKANIQNFSIIKKDYKDQNLYWTYKKNEKKIDNETDTERFNKTCIDTYIKNKEYIFINVILLSYERTKRLISFIKNSDIKHFYIEGNKFIYMHHKNKVYGFSLTTSDFYGLKTNAILKLIKSNKQNIILNDFKFLPNSLKKDLNFDIVKMMYFSDFFNTT